ncbi:hypothetical protein Dimus_000825, partial [Dionaea muscipula]
ARGGIIGPPRPLPISGSEDHHHAGLMIGPPQPQVGMVVDDDDEDDDGVMVGPPRLPEGVGSRYQIPLSNEIFTI